MISEVPGTRGKTVKTIGDGPSQATQRLERVCFGPYEANFHTQEFWKQGVRWKLSGQPFRILEVLVSRPGELVTREELQQQLWPEGTFTDFNHSLNAAIKKLREAVNDSANDPKYIETLPRRGYRFIGSIESPATQPASQPPSPAPVLEVAPVSLIALNTDGALGSKIGPPHVSKFRPRIFAVGVGCVLALVLIAVFVVDLPPHRAQTINEGRPGRAVASVVEAPVPTGGQMAQIAAQPHPTLHGPTILREAPLTGSAPVVHTVISDDSNNAGPQYSPDGKRLAFMSNRSGNWQIWVSAADGSDPMQLTYGGGAGTPRWSPDGQSITYDGTANEGTSIFVISVEKRALARKLVKGLVPSFSRDGKWIYFASGDDDDWQVRKIAVSNGEQRQVTRNGGFSAQESSDGYVYFSKSRFPNPEICRMPVQGGNEECTLPHLRPRTWSSWAITRSGILFVEDLSEGKSALSFYDPSKRQVSSLLTLNTSPFWMGATADGKKAIMNDNEERQISMVALQ